MEINENGINLVTENSIRYDIENALRTLYGEDFYIKNNGIIDSFVKVISDMELDFQDNIEEIIKNFNPETASGVFQDALYERIGVKRLEPKKTIFSTVVISDADTFIKAGEIRIQGDSKTKEFVNMADFVTNSNGQTLVDFIAVNYGDICVSNSDEFKLISAPVSVTGVDNNEIQNIKIGTNRETDEAFRTRFRKSKAINSNATGYADIANLNKYVDNENLLIIIDKKSDITYSPMEVKVIAKHNTTDSIFAQAVFDTLGSGIKMLGNTQINLTDLTGKNVSVKFQKASDINIKIYINLELASGVNFSEINGLIEDNILSYISKKSFGLGSVIYANEFVIPVLETDGIIAINSIKIEKENEGVLLDVIELEIDEVPFFSRSGIIVTEGE